MPKRFTDTEKWNKRFIRELKPAYKLLWFYILDQCNHAGIWDVDFDTAKLKVGMPITEKEAIKIYGAKITVIDKGEKWFVPAFIEFQYGTLAENNRAHTKVIFLLKKFKLIDELLKPLTRPLQGAKEEEEEKDMDKEQDFEKSEKLLDYTAHEKFMVKFFDFPGDVEAVAMQTKTIINSAICIEYNAHLINESRVHPSYAEWKRNLRNWINTKPPVKNGNNNSNNAAPEPLLGKVPISDLESFVKTRSAPGSE